MLCILTPVVVVRCERRSAIKAARPASLAQYPNHD